MKIVIDIDDESYEHIKAYKNDDVLPIGWYAISHGTPLTSDVPDINVGNKESEGEKMTREEAICKVEGYLTDIIPSENYSEVEEIMKALEQEPRWIPVSERLPKAQKNGDKDFSDWVQVTIDTGRNSNDIYVCEAYYCFSESIWYTRYTKRFAVGTVTAWVPLPEPYVPDINVGNKESEE